MQVYLTDKADISRNKEGNTIFWSSMKSGDNKVSLPRYVEKNADEIRRVFLEQIVLFGRTDVKRHSLSDFYRLSEGYNIWWMSTLEEKSPIKSPAIYQVVKLLALEHYLLNHQIGSIILDIDDKNVRSAIISLSKKHEISLNGVNQKIRKIKLVSTILSPLIAILSLTVFWFRRLPIRKEKMACIETNDVFLFSYIFNFDKKNALKGKYRPRQWGEIPEIIRSKKLGINWLNHYISSKDCPTSGCAAVLTKKLNRYPNQKDKFCLIEQNMTLCVYLGTVLKFLFLYARLFPVLMKLTSDTNTYLDYPWIYLLRNEWISSSYGKVAIYNILWSMSWDDYFSRAKSYRIGLYLYEGQGWEKALIQAWRKHQKHKLIGVAHTTVRYWDLRYHNFRVHDDILPDYIAINGLLSKNNLESTGCPINKLLDVEALRYAYLYDAFSSYDDHGDSFGHVQLSLLILGDISSIENHYLLTALNGLPDDILAKIKLLVKAHPATPINQTDYPSLDLIIDDREISHVLRDADYVYSANPTSAALDAYLSGCHVIMHATEDGFNMSPLRGVEAVSFVANSDELEIVLRQYLSVQNQQKGYQHQDLSDVFYLDPAYPRWNKLLTDYIAA